MRKEYRFDSLAPIPPHLLQLKAITEIAESDGVDAIRGVKLDSAGRLTWVFRDDDRIGRATLDGDRLTTRFLGTTRHDARNDAEAKKRQCKKGKVCGGSCIPMNRNCNADLPKDAAKEGKAIKEALAAKTPAKPKASKSKATKAKTPKGAVLTAAESSGTGKSKKVAPPTVEKKPSPLEATVKAQKAKAKASEPIAVEPKLAPKEPKPVTSLHVEDSKGMYDALNQMGLGLNPGKVTLSHDLQEQAAKWLTHGLMSLEDVQNGMAANEKTEKIRAKNPDITPLEATALSLWLGSGFTQMSEQVWKKYSIPNFKENPGILAATTLAAQAVHKLPKEDLAQISKRIGDWDIKHHTMSDQEVAAAITNHPWNRWMRIDSDVLDGFMAKYKPGETIREENFKGISHLPPERMKAFSNGANVVYQIKPKFDGTGEGRYVDDFKHKHQEGEILYPPNTQFKVIKVEHVSAYDPSKIDKNVTTQLYEHIAAAGAKEKIAKQSGTKADIAEHVKAIEEATGKPYHEVMKDQVGAMMEAWQKHKAAAKNTLPKDWNELYADQGYLIHLEEI